MHSNRKESHGIPMREGEGGGERERERERENARVCITW